MEFNFDNSSDSEEETIEKCVDIFIEQRNGKKSWTKIHGLNNYNIDLKPHLKNIKKLLCCNGAIKDDNNNKIIILQGDHRLTYKRFLINNNNIRENFINIHGF